MMLPFDIKIKKVSPIPVIRAKIEICNNCGKSVKLGSGYYTNRVPDLDTFEERTDLGKNFPVGAYLCTVCDKQIFGESNYNHHATTEE